MTMTVPQRTRAKLRRLLASRFARQELPVRSEVPLVSFTFDDAPVSAFRTGARVLEAHGARATFYLCVGLVGSTSEIGRIGERDDVERAAANGHELGCHTYDHSDAWETPPNLYLASVDRNRQALSQWLPEQRFASFAYPKSGPTLAVKRKLQSRFDCCRGGGQTFNAGVADLNQLSACFIDNRARLDMDSLEALIDSNAARRGWLVFAAHVLSDDDSAFACAPRKFEALVRKCIDSGTTVLPVAAACARLRRAAVADTTIGPARQPSAT